MLYCLPDQRFTNDKDERSALTCSIDKDIGFRAHDWKPRFARVIKIAEEDLTDRGFFVSYINLWESKLSAGTALLLEWSVDPPVPN